MPTCTVGTGVLNLEGLWKVWGFCELNRIPTHIYVPTFERVHGVFVGQARGRVEEAYAKNPYFKTIKSQKLVPSGQAFCSSDLMPTHTDYVQLNDCCNLIRRPGEGLRPCALNLGYNNIVVEHWANKTRCQPIHTDLLCSIFRGRVEANAYWTRCNQWGPMGKERNRAVALPARPSDVVLNFWATKGHGTVFRRLVWITC